MPYANIMCVYDLVSSDILMRMLKIFVTHAYVCQNIIWSDIIPSCNTVKYYCCKVCGTGQFTFSATFFIALVYLTDR